jgi:3-methyladenine DNA glycosylase AlkD
MPAKPTPRTIASEIKRGLRRIADQQVAERGRAFFKEPVRLMGVRAADMHRIAREVYVRVRSHWQLEQAVSLCDLLLPDGRFEVRAVAILLCERFSQSFRKSLFVKAQQWIEAGYCDSWGMVATICPCVLGPLIARYPELSARTRRWTRSANRWLRRAAAVSFVKLARRGKHLDEAYDIAGRLLADPDDLVRKATGWLLREAGRTDHTLLEAFVREHGRKCSRTTLRYAIEHFPEPSRKQILHETRKSPSPFSRDSKRSALAPRRSSSSRG